jgi:hypothetical protein
MFGCCLQAKLSTAQSAAQSKPDLGELGPLLGKAALLSSHMPLL